MNIQTMVFFYGAVCAAMILFNCACIYLFRRRARRADQTSKYLVERITAQLYVLESNGLLPEREQAFLERRLRNVKGLMSFDLAMEELSVQNAEACATYIRAIHPVFLHLGYLYLKKETTQGVYLLHVMEKYRMYGITTYDAQGELLLEYIKRPGIYCRSKALAVLCQTQRAERLADALSVLNAQTDAYFPERLLVTLLLSFTGDSQELIRLLLERFSSYQLWMQTAIISYVQQTSGQYVELFYRWLLEEPEDELRYALLRYFGQHRYEPVRELLYALVEEEQNDRWVDATIAATALRNYPGGRTIDVLKLGLTSRIWYVRNNAAESLERLGITYNELSDILHGKDRYAREMVTYRTERNNLRREVALP